MRGAEHRDGDATARGRPAGGGRGRECAAADAAAQHHRGAAGRWRRHHRRGRPRLGARPALSAPRHFLDLDRLDAAELRRILDLGAAYKANRINGKPAAGKFLAMVFEKPSTRTRMSFEVAMKELGGDVVVMDEKSSQVGRGETMADTARVMSRYVDAIMIRTGRVAHLDELAAHADVPVINGLTCLLY